MTKVERKTDADEITYKSRPHSILRRLFAPLLAPLGWEKRHVQYGWTYYHNTYSGSRRAVPGVAPERSHPDRRWLAGGSFSIDDVSDAERDMLVALMEECGGAVQAAARLISSGKYTRHNSGDSNIRKLGLELGDVNEMTAIAVAAGLADGKDIRDGNIRKRESFFQIQRETS
jgi:hypothetical protein